MLSPPPWHSQVPGTAAKHDHEDRADFAIMAGLYPDMVSWIRAMK
jgi:hypothetical protein